jgi:hypothetical protein
MRTGSLTRSANFMGWTISYLLRPLVSPLFENGLDPSYEGRASLRRGVIHVVKSENRRSRHDLT